MTAATGTAGVDSVSLGGQCWADADHDGDLDLLVCNGAVAETRAESTVSQQWRRQFMELGPGTFGTGRFPPRCLIWTTTGTSIWC